MEHYILGVAWRGDQPRKRNRDCLYITGLACVQSGDWASCRMHISCTRVGLGRKIDVSTCWLAIFRVQQRYAAIGEIDLVASLLHGTQRPVKAA